MEKFLAIPMHVLRPTTPLPNRLTQADDGEQCVPLAPGELAGPATVQPLYRKPKEEGQ